MDYYIDWTVQFYGKAEDLPKPRTGEYWSRENPGFGDVYSQGVSSNPAVACGAALRELRHTLAPLPEEFANEVMHNVRREAMEFLADVRPQFPWEESEELCGLVEVRIEFVPD